MSFDLEMVFRIETVIQEVRKAAKDSPQDELNNGAYLNGIRVGENF